MQDYQKNDNESQCVRELYINCEKGDYSNIKTILDEKDFSSKTLDFAIRRCLRNYKQDYREYFETLAVLLQYVDINYKNAAEDNSSILLLACEIGDANIVDLIVNNDYSTNLNYPRKIDINVLDDMNRNVIHYLINSSVDEDEAWEILAILLEVSEESINSMINQEDKNGYTPLSMSLYMGWHKFSKRLIELKGNQIKVLKPGNNNLIHYAIMGNNLYCLKLMLKESTIEDLKHKNKENLTPYELAKKSGQSYFSRIIKNFEENCDNKYFVNIFNEKEVIEIDDVFQKFDNKEYSETLLILNQLRINQNIKYDNSNYKDLSIEWNIFLTKYYLNKQKKISPESILSKFLDNKEPPNANVIEDFSNFFKNSIYCDDEMNVLDVIYLNKIIYHLKVGDYSSILPTAWLYIEKYLDKFDGMFYKWMVYVNMTLIVIEMFVSLRYTKIVDSIFEKLEEYLFFNYQLRSDDTIYVNHEILTDYLNEIELLNKYSMNWDESFCAVELLRAWKYLMMSDFENSRKAIRNYKRLYKLSNYVDELKVFKTLNNFYECIKIQLYYLENSTWKCVKKLDKFYKITEIKNFNIKIDKVVIKHEYNVNEYVLYYYNSQGILSLKLKKYQYSEYLFKVCIKLYKKYYHNNNFSIRLNWILSFKYNLALSYFYQKKYDKAYEIFKELVKNNTFNVNVYLWYRLGLCCLELHLHKLRQSKEDSQSDIISKIYGYEYYEDTESEEDYFKDIPDDEDNPPDKTDKKMRCKRIILQNNYHKVDNRYLVEAIFNLKQVLNVEKSNINKTVLSRNNEATKIFEFYCKKDHKFEELNKQSYKNINQIITSTYLNLLYSLSLSENWSEILFYCAEFERTEYYKPDSKEIKLRFDNYKIEALINLKENIKASELLTNNINLLSTGDMKASFINKVNYVTQNEISFKYSLLVNLIKIHYINNNLTDAEKCINNLLGLITTNTHEVPNIVHNILIYYHLAKGNTQAVLQILKYRKIPPIKK
jgi:hypothetical protein